MGGRDTRTAGALGGAGARGCRRSSVALLDERPDPDREHGRPPTPNRRPSSCAPSSPSTAFRRRRPKPIASSPRRSVPGRRRAGGDADGNAGRDDAVLAPPRPRADGRPAQPGGRQSDAAPRRRRRAGHPGLAARTAPRRASGRRGPAHLAQGRADRHHLRLPVARRARDRTAACGASGRAATAPPAA